jgi:hypothetical protein
MIELKYELDTYPMVMNRSVVNIYPTKIYLDWLNYIRGSDVSLGLHDIDPISFLIQDFETRNQFDEWIESNYILLFDIRLNYSSINKSMWPKERTFNTFNDWIQVKYSNMILDLVDESIKTTVNDN